MSDSPGGRLARNQALQQRVSRLLLDPANKKAYEQNAMAHAEISLLRDLVQRTDQALQAEGIAEEIRDRVAHRVIFGEPPELFGQQAMLQAEQIWKLPPQADGLPETEPEKP